MQKYYIPECLGTSAVCDKITVGIFDEESNMFLSTWTMTWPKNNVALLDTLLETFTERLKERGFVTLSWGFKTDMNVRDQYIAPAQMWFVTEKIDFKRIAINIDGKKYNLLAEKVDALLKGLE